MTADLAAMFGAEPSKPTLDENPAMALTLALTYQTLGGYFSIDSNGRRGIGRMFEPGASIPQIPAAKPHQRLGNCSEWLGAMNLLETLIEGLDSADKVFIFDALALCAVDPRCITETASEPTRRAA